MDGDRIEKMAERVSFFVLAGEQPDSLFTDVFSVVREKARDYKEVLELKARDSLKSDLIKDLKDRGHDVVSVEISLGKYRGSRFVTSAKVRVVSNDARQAKSLVKVLQRYHPRYSLKSFDEKTKQAEYNIR